MFVKNDVLDINGKDLPQYRFLEYNLMSSLKNDDLWLEFMETIAKELYLQRLKITETRNMYNYNEQLQDGIIQISEMFGYIPNLIVDNSLEILRKEYESIPFRIRNKTTYDGYRLIFKQISELGEIYNYYWDDKKFIKAIKNDDILESLLSSFDPTLPFTKIIADVNFSSISNLDKVLLDTGFTVDQIVGKHVWRLDENTGVLPTKHLGFEYYADDVFEKDGNKYLMTSEYFQYLTKGVEYTRRNPIVPHIGIQITPILYESEAFDYFNEGEEFSIPKIELKGGCGFTYMKGFTKQENFTLDNSQNLDNLVNWVLDASVEGKGRPSNDEFKYISCGCGVLPLLNTKNKYIYNYSTMGLFYTFSDDDSSTEIKDYSMNKYNATLHGHTKKVEGVVGKSVDWDGKSWVKSNSKIIIPSSSFTFGLWVKSESDSTEEKCVFDFDFLKLYFDNNSNEFKVVFNNEISVINGEKNKEYDFLFEFDSDDKKLNVYANGINELSINTTDVEYFGEYTLYIGTDSNIEDDEENLKFVGIIDNMFIEGKKFTQDEISYLYTSKVGLVTHLANKLATYEISSESEITESELWRMISSQVQCNDIKDEFVAKIDEDSSYYIGYTNFAPIKPKTFNFEYTKDLVFTTKQVKIEADSDGNFFTYTDDGEGHQIYTSLGGHIDYETGHYLITKTTPREVLDVLATQEELEYDNVETMSFFLGHTNIVPNTVNIRYEISNGIYERTDEVTTFDPNIGEFVDSDSLLRANVNYKTGYIGVVFQDDKKDLVTSSIKISYKWEDDLKMLNESTIHFNYKVENGNDTNIREIALENNQHEILAYITFPPIQANDEYNYVSTNFLIRKNV